MRLRSLNIKGFKSFANDTTLHFNEQVIGIVGPNGSGKSNIVDAIRWVLGEQKSKELRLEAMSDVIFNGTKTKKEAPTAFVSLTFDNDKGILPTEYQTVEISRTLYRSGESEYRLNNVLCRLKDINSLLIDTGIGSNSYAIIALGMVDDILNDKDDSRRKMFEQAAGISKYKIRKRETIQKLKSTTEDLNRVDDLLFEIEGNLKALEKQAKRAQKYLEIRDDYKNLSIHHSVASIQFLKLKYKDISDALARDQDEYRKNDVLVHNLTAQIEKHRKMHVDKEVSISAQQKALNDLVYKIRSLEHEKNLLFQKLEFIDKNKEKLQALISTAGHEKTNLTQDIQNISTQHDGATAKEASLSQAVANALSFYEQIKQQYTIAKKTEDENIEIRNGIEKKIFEAEKNAAIVENTKENYLRENQRLQDQILKKSEDNKGISEKLQALLKQISLVEKDLQLTQEGEEKRKLRITEAEKHRDTLQESLNKINRYIDSKQNEYDLLKSMIDSYEGFAESNKFISIEWKDKAIQVADIFDVQDEYRTAIEWLLEDVLHHFVVNTEREALMGITLLKDAQKGKSRFIVLDKLPSKKLVKSGYPDMICARDVVKCAQQYEKLADFLFGDTYIYLGKDDFLSYDKLPELVISARGTLMKGQHILSGGSVGLFEGKKIGRKQNLEKISQILNDQHVLKSKIQSDLSSVKNEIESLKANHQSKQIEVLRKNLEQLNQEKAKTQSLSDTVSVFIQDTDKQISNNNTSIKETNKNLTSIVDKISQLKLSLQEFDEKLLESEGQNIHILSEKMTSASEDYNNANITLIRHQNLILNFKKDIDFKQARLRELDSNITSNEEKLLYEDKDKINIQDEISGHTQSLEKMYVDKSNFQNTLSEVERVYFASKNEITELEESLRTLTRQQNALQLKIQDNKDTFSDQKYQIQTIGERLKIEFGISINEVINLPEYQTEIENLDDINIQIEKVRQKIQSFGDVNPLALEAYAEMKERYDTIVQQRNDIITSRDSLMETIDEIEVTATKMYLDSFEQIRTNFIQVFRSLFTEDDTCDLVILDTENPLESEIDIIAKPKGKKPKSLSQLSGGEKTLTATALLFALYLLKPAPFCIFDEVDAPLDDANIQKFNNIIRTFSKDSQFIIVTHNKATMAEVNILYGIYMREQGVSSISAVDFRALKYDPKFESLN